MIEFRSKITENAQLNILRIYLLLIFLQGIGVIIWIISNPSGRGQSLLAALSSSRLLVLAIVASVDFILLILLIRTWTSQQKALQNLENLRKNLLKPRRWKIALLLCLLGLITSSYSLTLIPEITEPFTRAILDRALPIILWLVGLSLQSAIFLAVFGNNKLRSSVWRGTGAFYWSMIVFLCVIAGWVLFARRYIPEAMVRTGWNATGTPIIEWQVFIAWFVAILVWLILRKYFHSQQHSSIKLKGWKLDMLLAVLLWAIAAFYWQSIPISESWFVSEPVFPTFEHFPTSDARSYDGVVQDVMVGAGFRFAGYPIVRRPLHAFYLLILHLLGGQNYLAIVRLQVLVFAGMPVMAYLLIKNLHNRLAGLIAAILIIFREANSIAIADVITASHVKLLMVDLAAAYLSIVFVYFAIRWLQQERKSAYALASGCLLGLTMLVRLETFVYMFPLFLLAGIYWGPRRRLKHWLKQIVIFFAGITLVISPWVWRNWDVTGELFIDSPGHRQSLIKQRFGSPPVLPSPPAPEPNNTSDVFDSSTKTGSQTIGIVTIPEQSNFEFSHPTSIKQFEFQTFTIYFIVHYLNNHIQNMLIFPTTWRGIDSVVAYAGHRSPAQFIYDCCSIKGYVRRLPFWHSWVGVFPGQSILPLMVIIIILALGISKTWEKRRWVGLVPAALSIAYMAGNALYRNSGGRYLLPVDWISILYFSIGLAYLTTGLLGWVVIEEKRKDIFTTDNSTSTRDEAESFHLRQISSALIVIVLALVLAAAIPLAERSFPDQYPEKRQTEMAAALLSSSDLTAEQRSGIQSFLDSGGLVNGGRILYPQYKKATNDNKPDPFGTKNYDRLIFYLAGKYSRNLELPIETKPPFFPNNSDAIVFYCAKTNEEITQVLGLGIFDAAGVIRVTILRSPFPENPTCPLP